jgi:hypothetical protein
MTMDVTYQMTNASRRKLARNLEPICSQMLDLLDERSRTFPSETTAERIKAVVASWVSTTGSDNDD